MMGIADDSDDGGVELGVGAAFVGDEAAEGVLGRAEEFLCEFEIDDGDLCACAGVGSGELATDEEGLAKGGEVAGRDPRGFEVVVFVFGGFVTFDGVAVAVGVAGELGIGGGSGGGDAGDAADGVESAGDDLRGAVFAVAGVIGIEAQLLRMFPDWGRFLRRHVQFMKRLRRLDFYRQVVPV